MHYTLRGKIARAHPYQLDTTLTVYGAGAEAKATGEAIVAAVNLHTKSKNPHNVTKDQVGLGKADNTADMEKPVSTYQAQAIEAAKAEVTEALMAESNTKATTEVLRGSLLASEWSESAPFTQTVTVEGLKHDDYPLADIDLSEVEDVLSVLEGWNAVGRLVVEGDDALTAYCYEEAPVVNIPVILKVVR